MMGSDEGVKVVSFVLSPVGRRVEWGLRLKGVKYDYIEEDMFNKSNLLLDLNPVHKKVPVLVHAHKPIAESLIIVEYIDDIWNQYPLMPHDPYQRALTRFWVNFADQEIMYGAWRAMCSIGEEQEKKVNAVRGAMEKMEELIEGKRFFGGDSIGYLDIALGWMSWWLPVWEEVGSMQVMDPVKFSGISAWKTNFLSHPAIKDCIPPRDKMLPYFHHRRNQFCPALHHYI